MKNIIYILILVVNLSNKIYSQHNMLNAKSPEEVWSNLKKNKEDTLKGEDNPLPFPKVTDVMWSKEIWEIVDLNEKFNFSLYFPIDTSFIEKNRRSLFDVLLGAISRGEITSIYDNSYFTSKLTYVELKSFLERIDTTELGIEQLNSGLPVSPEYIQKTTISSRDIQQIRIRGVWYIDKIHGEMRYRPIAIAPVAPDVNEKFSEDPDMVELFWVWYADARNILHKAKSYNENNASKPVSYDQIIVTRRFNGMIYLESNMYGNRKIQDYIKENAMLQLQESKKIKEEIREKELNLWEY